MAKCSNCESELIVHKAEYDIYAFCAGCLETKYIAPDRENCCFNPSLKAVKIKGYGGSIRVNMQCENCGYSHGYAIKKSDYDLDSLEFKDDNKAEEFFNKKQIESIEYKKIFDEYKRKKKNENNSIELKFPGYSEYLTSPSWREKREIVFKRDNYLCQACLKNSAVQVHHLSYKHIFNEPLFDLISVCIRCHDIITNIGRNIETDKIKH